jgi:Tol biopolymer transport system component
MRTAFSLAFLSVAVVLGAQSPPEPRLVRLSNPGSVANEWINPGDVSKDGRFVVGATTDSGLAHYDRTSRSWARIVGPSLSASAPRWSPDGRFLAYQDRADGRREFFVWIMPIDPATGLPKGTARRVTTRSSGPPTWSPDGRRIAFLSPDSTGVALMTVPFNGGEEQILYRANAQWVFPRIVVWSADGQFVVATMQRGGKPELVRVTVATKHAEWLNQDGFGLFAISGDGKQVATFARNTPYLAIGASSVTGGMPQRYVMPPNVVPAAWVSPNEFVGFAHPLPGSIERVSMGDGAIKSITPFDSSGVGDGFYSPDGKRIAYTRKAATGPQLMVADADGGNSRAIGIAGSVSQIAWSPSGAQIAYVSYAPLGIRVVDVASGADRAVNSSVNTIQQKLRWRSDGKAIWFMAWKATATALVREVHEVTMDGKDRLIATLPSTNQPPGFVNDTLIVVLEPKGLSALNLKTGKTRMLYSGGVRANNGDIDLSRDGKWLALVSEEGNVEVPLLVSLTTGEARKIPYTIGGEVSNAYFMPDGRSVVVSSCPTCNTGRERWDIVQVPINGDPPRVLTASESEYRDHDRPSIAPDGKSIIFAAERSWNTRVVTITLPKP